MITELPSPLGGYFAATNAHDVAAMIAAFAEGSVVQDEGRQYRGLIAIRGWMKQTIEKYDFKVDPIEVSATGRETVVVVTIHGRFPGSPITLRYEFTVEDQKISRLEIG